MPKIWLINVEEVVSADDAQYESVWAPMATGLGIRFLFCIEPGDLLVSPVDIPEDFIGYVRRVNGWPDDRQPILPLRKRSRPYSLVDSVLEDARLTELLMELGWAGGWVLEPYLDSRKTVELSEETGIPTDKTHPESILNGTILKLNDKGTLRALVDKLGVPTVPGYLARDLESITAAMDKVSRENNDRIYLKKTRYASGMGNLSGGRGELLRKLPTWYNRGEVVVEHALDFESVAGTLMTLGPDSVRFWGVDQQRFEGHRWGGFDFPHPDREASAELCRLSLKIATTVHRQKARGDLNLDWGLLREDGRLRPMLLECNFRHNGFGQILRFCRMYFGPRAERMRISFFIHFGLRDRAQGFQDLARALAGVSCAGEPLLIDSPGRERGIVLMTPPQSGHCTLAVFGNSQDYMDQAQTLLQEALA